jgi:hypothetical protein
MTPIKLIVHKIVVLLLLFLFGCSCNHTPLKPEGFPQLYPCTVIVEQESKPISGVQVSMRSTDPSVTWSVGGTTDTNGTLKVLTHGVHLGAPAGEYKILLIKQKENEYPNSTRIESTTPISSEKNISQEELGDCLDIDQKYSDVTTTPFTITVKKTRKNSIKCNVDTLISKRIH